jgi:hypothetical protein
MVVYRVRLYSQRTATAAANKAHSTCGVENVESVVDVDAADGMTVLPLAC